MATETSDRGMATTFGLFFAGTFLFSIPALAFYGPLLTDPAYVLRSGPTTRVSAGAFSEILLAICNVATALVVYPVLRRVGAAASLGYVAVRIVESLLILSGVAALMSMVTLRSAAMPGADADAMKAVGQGLLAFHAWTFLLGPQFCAGLGNGVLLGTLMYRSKLVPPRMAMIGMVGGPLAFAGGALVLFGVLEPMSRGLFMLTVLEIAWELSVTYYALRYGFRADSESHVAHTRDPALP
jgi:hypothetical protein